MSWIYIRREFAAVLALLLNISSSLAFATDSQRHEIATDGNANTCPSSLTEAIPARSPKALDGTQFAAEIAALDSQIRENVIENAVLQGDVPSFLRWLKPVKLRAVFGNGRAVDATICVMPDYLAIGDDDNFLRIPMNLRTATAIATRFRFTLPTRKMVDAIYQQSDIHLDPQPMQAGPQMSSTDYYVQHNRSVSQQLQSFSAQLGALIAGDKKDVVISNRLATHPGQIAIYGWHKLDGKPIQPLSTVHGANYADYSHGIRLVSDTMYIDGKPASLHDVLQDPQLAALVSDEGPVPILAQLIR